MKMIAISIKTTLKNSFLNRNSQNFHSKENTIQILSFLLKTNTKRKQPKTEFCY